MLLRPVLEMVTSEGTVKKVLEESNVDEFVDSPEFAAQQISVPKPAS